MSTVKKPVRLPPLRVLRIRNPTRKEVNPCLAVMQSVLACWASAGYSASGCLALEEQLRACSDGPKTTVKKANSINYHLSRLHHKLGGGRKKD